MADFTPDRVQFQGFSNATTHRHPYNELRKVALSSPVRSCPPAARAVRACTKDTSVDVFILVDQKGGVAFAEAIAAHPLLRSAAVAAVKEWRFTPLVIDGSSMNQAGIVKISFEEGPAILTNE